MKFRLWLGLLGFGAVSGLLGFPFVGGVSFVAAIVWLASG